MDLNKNKELQKAYFANEFALKANINFDTARMWTFFLVLVSQLNSTDEEAPLSGHISVADIEDAIKTDSSKKWGNFYSELMKFTDKMMSGRVYFNTDIKIDGKPFPRMVNLFSSLQPVEAPSGNPLIEYTFNENMRPLLLGLKKQFVGINPPKGIKSGHAIRFLLLAKAQRDKERQHSTTTKILLAVIELKERLGIKGKYKVFKDFRRWVIEPMVGGVNQSGIIEVVKYNFIKTGRKITHIEFFIKDGKYTPGMTTALPNQNNGGQDYEPSKEDEAVLTKAEQIAYHYLINNQIKKGIAYRQIIKKMPSNECKGFEDIYLRLAWERYEKSAKYSDGDKKAGAFVKWYVKGEFHGTLFSEIMEQLIQVKKEMESKGGLLKRLQASTMTAVEFDALHTQEQIPQEEKETVSGIQTGSEILEKYKPTFDEEQWRKDNAGQYKSLRKKVIAEYKEAYGDAFDEGRLKGKIEEKIRYYATKGKG